eukprot:624508-Prymnesium_polylepis.4
MSLRDCESVNVIFLVKDAQQQFTRSAVAIQIDTSAVHLVNGTVSLAAVTEEHRSAHELHLRHGPFSSRWAQPVLLKVCCEHSLQIDR